MTIPLIATFSQTIFMFLLGGMAVFLILLVLVQRGRGGGLAGALGGMGGSSAFGAKAGDVFTKITVGAATIWIVLCIVAASQSPNGDSRIDVETILPPATEGSAITSADDSESETTAESFASEESASESSTNAEPADRGEEAQ